MAADPLPESDRSSRADTIFARFLADAPSGAEPDFDALIGAHPELAPELRQRRADYERLRPILRLAGLDGSRQKRVADEVRSKFGPGVDPSVSLGGEKPEQDSGPSSELLKRLRRHAPANSRYKLLGEVGRGGMGAVLKIWDEDLRRTLAMKVVLGKDVQKSKADPAGKGDPAAQRASPGKPGPAAQGGTAAQPADASNRDGPSTDDGKSAGSSSNESTPSIDARTLGRFLEEAQITGQLDHPGIVPVHELGLDSDGRVYFTMRLVKGEDLRRIYEHVESGHDGWNETRALTVLLKVCEAMSYAHDKGVVHRDLKPANIMVGKYGEVYVMDWGLARVLGQEDRHDVRIQRQAPASASVRTERRSERDEAPDSPLVTMDGEALGTPVYMSPEQARSEVEQLGPHSDVYSLGAMLYHLIARQLPYVSPGARIPPYMVLMRVIEGPPRPLLELAPRAPAELVSICEKAMQRDIARRYPDMRALAEDLRAYLERYVVKAHESGTWAETRKWVQRNKPLAASLGAFVLALSGGIVFSMLKMREAETARRGADAERFKADVARNEAEIARNSADDANEELLVALKEIAEANEMRIHQAQVVLAKNLELTRAQEELGETNTRLALSARDSALRGMIPELAFFEALDDDVYSYVGMRSTPVSESWLKWAHRLVDGVPGGPVDSGKWRPGLTDVENALADLRTRALARTPGEREVDHGSHPQSGGLVLDEQRTWHFQNLEDEWWNGELVKLADGLRRLAKQVEFAEASIHSAEAERAWAEAIAAISSSEQYRGTRWPGGDRLTPQLGLVPIGPDPDSGLWEFAHLATGKLARRGSDRKLVLEPNMGLVLVLLPGGRVPIANAESQGQDPSLTRIDLDPFFMSKFEMTVGQWDSLGGWRRDTPNRLGGLIPASEMSWDDCQVALLRNASWLRMPSAAQWEYGCRAGTTTTWWPGDSDADLRGVANVWLPDTSRHEPSTIGASRANPFGLCDVHGNVREWCGDSWGGLEVECRPGDGLRYEASNRYRETRGGSYLDAAYDARSSASLRLGGTGTHGLERTQHDEGQGLRPARGVTP